MKMLGPAVTDADLVLLAPDAPPPPLETDTHKNDDRGAPKRDADNGNDQEGDPTHPTKRPRKSK